MAPTGSALIGRRIAETGAPLGGEVSGHIRFAAGGPPYDDAIYAAMRFLDRLYDIDVSLAVEADRIRGTSIVSDELRLACDDRWKAAVVTQIRRRMKQTGVKVRAIDGVRVEKRVGWWLVRASSTEPALTLRVEANSRASFAELADELRHQLALAGIRCPPGAIIRF